MNAIANEPGTPRLLGVFAHPDDETLCAGGTLAQHVDQGGQAMVVSFTRGQRGQIRDPDAATRHTLGAVRQQEFYRACEHLGVRHALCLDYMDGGLAELDPQILISEVSRLIRAFEPDTILTFNHEGGYGHPDHIAISDAVTRAFHQARAIPSRAEQRDGGIAPHTPTHLYHNVFVRQHRTLGMELASWLMGLGTRYQAPAALVNAMPSFAHDVTTLGFASDDARIYWYAPGTSIIEPGEVGDSLFLILSGHVDLVQETDDGPRRVLAIKGPGEFLGEDSLLDRQPSRVHAVAASGVTCLVLARDRPSVHVPRGAGPRALGKSPSAREGPTDDLSMMAIDVSPYLEQKLAALRAHRTQYPAAPDLLPTSILQRLLGTEFFLRVSPPLASASADSARSIESRQPRQAA